MNRQVDAQARGSRRNKRPAGGRQDEIRGHQDDHPSFRVFNLTARERQVEPPTAPT